MHVIVKSFGLTPAYNVVSYLTSQIRNDVADLEVLVHGDNPRRESMSIAPGHESTALGTIPGLPLEKRGWSALHEENYKVYVWGEVQFVDAFRKQRWITFQVVHDLKGTYNFAVCAAGNDASDNYEH